MCHHRLHRHARNKQVRGATMPHAVGCEMEPMHAQGVYGPLNRFYECVLLGVENWLGVLFSLLVR